MSLVRKTTAALILALAGSAAFAGEVTVKDPWVRGTVPAQKATGAFMILQSADGAVLKSAASPVAGVVEVHEMAMDGGVMKMRAVPQLDLPAGKAVELKPGGYHIMLMELKKPLGKGEIVPITLTVEGADKKTQTLEVKAEVRPLAAAAPAAGGMDHGKHMHH